MVRLTISLTDCMQYGWKGGNWTLDVTYGMKDASGGQTVFCFSRGRHPSYKCYYRFLPALATFRSEML